ncbi:ribonuclease R, partial [Streptococcus thoraltensis]
MKEQILNYLKEHGKSNINDLAASLDMAGAKKFPLLIKEISKMESKRELRFNDDGMLSLRKPQEKKEQITVQGVFRANKAGFGFLFVDENEDDMFIGRNDVGYAVDGDTVE